MKEFDLRDCHLTEHIVDIVMVPELWKRLLVVLIIELYNYIISSLHRSHALFCLQCFQFIVHYLFFFFLYQNATLPYCGGEGLDFEAEFVNVLGAQESMARNRFSQSQQPCRPVQQIGLAYRPARLAELTPWNRFLGSLNVYKFRALYCSL